MTAAEFEVLSESEAEKIIAWRFHELSNAGYEVDDALCLATHTEIDLHVAADLIRRGCPPKTAFRILI
jgi:hypothetical protein